MKSQKGVTLMLLVATIIVMAIIFGTITYSSTTAIKMREYYNMCSDIELLDEKIALYYIENKDTELSLPITEETCQITSLISDYSEENVNYNPNNSGTLYKIDLTKLDNLSLTNTSVNYFIDIKSHTIYRTVGINMDGYTYYTVPINYQPVSEM